MENSNEYLLRNSLAQEYKMRINNIERLVKPLLSRTTNVNATFTEHTLDHALSVENLYGICFKETVDILSDDEKFLLISATLVHDIGMVGDSRFIDREGYGEEIRNSHNYRSGDFIDEFRTDLGLNIREADAIKRIASSHRVVPLNSIDEKEAYGQGGCIRVRLLSALIRFADELDFLEERAPYLVKEFLGISNESLIHHERHEVMTGINRNENSIYIKAIAYNYELEKAINDMYNEILEKHFQVRQILSDNNIDIKQVIINIDVSRIIKKELLIFIAKVYSVSEEKIYEYFSDKKRKENDVDAAISELKSRKYIIYNANEKTFSLNDNVNSFKEFVKLFIGGSLELEFTKSIYVKKYLDKNFEKYVNDNFGVIYDAGDKDDRIEILTHFPISLKYFIDERNTPYEFGNIDRRVTLDYGLLHAFSIDVLKYTDEVTENVFYAVEAIEKSLNENSFNFFKLMKTIPDVKKKIDEFYNKMSVGNIGNNTDKGTFTITTTKKKDQLKNTDFATIFVAASTAGIPVEISRNIKLENLILPNEESNNIVNKSNAITSLKIIPNVNYNELDIYYLFKFELNAQRRELNIYLFTGQHKDIDKYPFNLCISSSKKGVVTIKTNHDLSEKISDRISYNEMMTLWSERGLRRLNIYGLNGLSESITIVPDKIDMSIIKCENKFNRILNRAKVTTDEFPCIICNRIISEVNELSKDIDDEDFCNELLQKYKNMMPKDQTKVFGLLKNEDGDILSSVCLGIFPYLMNLDFLKKQSYNNKESKNSVKDIIARKRGISISRFLSDDSMYNLFTKIINMFFTQKKSFIKVFNELLSCKGTCATGKLCIEIKEAKQGFWSRTQQIIFIFQIADKEIEDRNKLNELLTEEKLVDAIPLLESREYEMLEDLAFAYYVKGDYKRSLATCEKSIKCKYHSVAHFTKGLVYLAQKDYDRAFESYMLGIYLVKPDIWYPKIKENIKKAINQGKIEENEKVKYILDKIELYRRVRKYGKRLNTCFCGSRKKFYDCHGKNYKL